MLLSRTRISPDPASGAKLLACALLACVGLLTASCSSPPAPPSPAELPIADAGPDQAVALGQQVTLNGSASRDPESQPLAYLWTSGEANPTAIVLTPGPIVRFTPTEPGAYVFFLMVVAQDRTSLVDSVEITVTGPDNDAPLAHAGLDAIYPLDAVIFLDGSNSSDADGDSLRYMWEVFSGPGPVAFSDSSAQQTSLTVATDGQYTFRLTVSDEALSSTDDVVILVSPAGNAPPQASAGEDQLVPLGTPVTLDGTASSDPDGDNEALIFSWVVGRTPGEAIALSDSTTAQPSFTPAQTGTYVIGLQVNDGIATSIQDVVTITVVIQAFNKRGGMIEVPAGAFVMGSDIGLAGEQPEHTVDLATFWIDSVEVATAQYRLCVEDGVCSTAGQSPGCNASRSDRDDHPINCVDWDQANTFCTWASKRLPTEAEWEKAARGEDQRVYPWGDADPSLLLLGDPNIRLLNYLDLTGTTAPVGMHPDGVSFYGVHNMGGNVMEWTSDWFASDYYSSSPSRDPQGPSEGLLKVARGGHWQAGFVQALTTTVRNATVTAQTDTRIGFRCARTDPP